MAKKRSAKERQDHPKGPLEWVDDDWKARVRAEMNERAMDQKQFAKKLDISEGAISNLFKPGPKQIRYKGDVHRLFGWSDAKKTDDGLRRVTENWSDIPEGVRDAILKLVDSTVVKP
jgi:transcriptional regulator with XRE-family HTH domain